MHVFGFFVVKSIITILDKTIYFWSIFLKLGDKIQRGKERFPFFILLGVLFSNWYKCLK